MSPKTASPGQVGAAQQPLHNGCCGQNILAAGTFPRGEGQEEPSKRSKARGKGGDRRQLRTRSRVPPSPAAVPPCVGSQGSEHVTRARLFRRVLHCQSAQPGPSPAKGNPKRDSCPRETPKGTPAKGNPKRGPCLPLPKGDHKRDPCSPRPRVDPRRVPCLPQSQEELS